MIVGLTGPTGSGKSRLVKLLIEKGVSCIDCDQLSREVVLPNTTGLDALVEAFGEKYLLPSGELDRKKLGRLVFSDREALATLNQTLHHELMDALKAKIASWEASQAADSSANPILILDAPTLFQSGADDLCDWVISVVADDQVRKVRIMERDQLTEAMAEGRIASGLPMDFYKKHADFVIENNGDHELLVAEAEKLYESLLAKATEK